MLCCMRKKTGEERVRCKISQFIPRKSLFGVGEQILIGDIRAEEGWIVRVEGDEKPGFEVAAERMGGKRGTNAGAHIGGRVQLKHNPTCSQFMEETRVLHR